MSCEAKERKTVAHPYVSVFTLLLLSFQAESMTRIKVLLKSDLAKSRHVALFFLHLPQSCALVGNVNLGVEHKLQEWYRLQTGAVAAVAKA